MKCIGGASHGLNVSHAHKDHEGRIFDLKKPYKPVDGKYIRPSRRPQKAAVESYVVRKLACGYFLVFTALTDQAAMVLLNRSKSDATADQP